MLGYVDPLICQHGGTDHRVDMGTVDPLICKHGGTDHHLDTQDAWITYQAVNVGSKVWVQI